MEERKVSVSPRDIRVAFNDSKDITSTHALTALKYKLIRSLDVNMWWIKDGHWWYTKNSGGMGHYDYDTDVKGREATTDEILIWASVQAIEKIMLDLEL